MTSPTAKMPRWSKWLLTGAALLAGAAWWVLVRTFPPQRLAALAAQQLSEASGRAFRIDGPLSLRLLPRIAIVAEDARLANPSGFSRPDMLRVQRTALILRILPLLHGEVNIDQVALDGVDLLLETRADGSDNWHFDAGGGSRPAPAPAGAESGSPPALVVDLLQLANVHLAYRDARGGTGRSVDLGSLQIQRQGHSARVAASAKVAGQAWTLKGEVGSLAVLLANQSDWPFDLRLQGNGATVAAKGALAHGKPPRGVSLTLSATLDKADALGAAATPAVARALPLRIDTHIDWNGARLQADPLQLGAAGQKLQGRLTAQPGTPWQLRGRLQADALDLSHLLGASTAAKSGAPARRQPFDATPLPWPALPALRADIALQVGRLVAPGVPPLANLKTTVVLRPPEWRADDIGFSVAGGEVQGHLALRQAPAALPELAVQLDGRGLSAPALAQAAGAQDYLTRGRARLDLELRMAGDSTQALAASADGQLLLQADDLQLGKGKSPLGPNLLPRLLAALRPGQASDSGRIDCVVVRLPLNDGVAAVDRSVAIETDSLAISASGEVNLRDQTLQLAFHPTSKAALGVNTAQLASLVLVKGPLLDPKLTLDANGAANMALQIGAAAATGGLSVLGERLLRSGGGDTHPCQFALTGVASKPPPAAAPKNEPAGPAKPASKPLPELLRKIFK